MWPAIFAIEFYWNTVMTICVLSAANEQGFQSAAFVLH
jgi:hypothetical protein